jgi:succinate dehydrogenase/fumarate reductase-like Fe-S protein
MPMKTEAFVLEKVNSDFKLETVELDDPQDGEVLVEGEQAMHWPKGVNTINTFHPVVACGLCHSKCNYFGRVVADRYPTPQICGAPRYTQLL